MTDIDDDDPFAAWLNEHSPESEEIANKSADRKQDYLDPLYDDYIEIEIAVATIVQQLQQHLREAFAMETTMQKFPMTRLVYADLQQRIQFVPNIREVVSLLRPIANYIQTQKKDSSYEDNLRTQFLEFKRKLLAIQLPPDVFAMMQQTVANDTDIQMEFNKDGLIDCARIEVMNAIQHCDFRKTMGGQLFLESACMRGLENIPSINYRGYCRILELQKQITPPEENGCVWIIFALLEGDVAAVEKLIVAQATTEKERPEGSENFFQYTHRFLGVCADITQNVLDLCQENYDEESLRRFSRLMRSVFTHSSLLQMEHVNGDTEVNLHSIASECLCTGNRSLNPWLHNDIDETPYSEKYIGRLLTFDVPREVIARCLVYLNDWEKFDKLSELVKCYKAMDKISTEGSEVEEDADPDDAMNKVDNDDEQVKAGEFEENIFGTFLEMSIDADLEDDGTFDEDNERMSMVSDPQGIAWADEEKAHMAYLASLHSNKKNKKVFTRMCQLCEELHLNVDTNETLGVILQQIQKCITSRLLGKMQDPLEATHIELGPPERLPRHALLRMVDPEKIAHDKDGHMQNGFKELLEHIMRDSVCKQGDVIGDPGRILAESLQLMLYEDNGNLDVAVAAFQSRGKNPLARSVRDLLMDFGNMVLHPDFIRFGPNYQPGDNAECTKGLSLYRMVLGETTYDYEKRNDYNVAERGHVHPWLKIVAQAALKGKAGGERYEHALRIGRKEVKRYLGTGNDYNVYFYPNGKAAFVSLLQHCFPSVKRRRQIIGDREYADMTHDLGANGIDVVYYNKPRAYRACTANEMFKQIVEKADSKQTDMILLSVDTRFGDALCPAKDNKYHYNEIQKLVARLREDPRTAHIPIGLDICQTAGRCMPPALQRLGVDFAIFSGKKALGAEAIGGIVISKEFERKMTKKGKPYSAKPSSLLEEQIVAMAQMMRLLGGKHNLINLEENFGANRHRTFQEDIAIDMRKFTERAITRADTFGQRFFDEHLKGKDILKKPNLLGADKDELKEWFGCLVYAPVHRNVKDYNGMITVSFPFLNGALMSRRLQKNHEMNTLACRRRNRCVRISFDYTHHKLEDIDRIFDAMLETQAEILLEEIDDPVGLRYVDKVDKEYEGDRAA